MTVKSQHIQHLARLIQTSIDALYSHRALLNDADKLDLLEASRKLQNLFQGQHPRYFKSQGHDQEYKPALPAKVHPGEV